MAENITEQTIAAIKDATDIRKANTVTTATGLTAYRLDGPAKNLYPVLTPVRNRLPREQDGVGLAANFKVVTGVGNANGFAANPFLAEGQRAAAMTVTAVPKSVNYKTIGLDGAVTMEAINAAVTFEDEKAATAVRLLEQVMLMEEFTLVGSNNSLALGTPTTPSTSASGTGSTLPAAAYSVIVVALTYEGWANAGNGTANTLTQTKTITGQDGLTYVQNGGYSAKSAAAAQTTTSGQTLFASVTAVAGAIAYAWYVGAAGSEKLEAITTINSVSFSAPLAGTGQLASALSAGDYSTNTLAYDGMLYSAFNSGGASIIKVMPSGTSGTGTPLTSSGRGSVVEIDAVCKQMWDKYQLSPSVMMVNSQELTNISNKIYQNASQPLLQYLNQVGSGQVNTVIGGGTVSGYFNPYTADQSKKVIPIILHPNIPPGTILMWAEELPAQYKRAETPRLAAVRCRRDYYQIDWAQIRRAYEIGVYAEQTFVPYFPAGFAIITNIANG